MDEPTIITKQIGKNVEIISIHSPPASLHILPRGGRILGVDLGIGNLLWTNPKIIEVLKRGEWNTGGIRTWISPEQAFFYHEPQKFGGWRCPPGIDPANYRVVSKGKRAVELESTISAKDMISKETLNGKIRKRFELVEAHQEEGAISARIRILDFLTVEDYHRLFALWTLIQVPTGDEGGGKLIVPVVKGARPIHYFGPIPGSYLKVFENHVEFTIDGQRELKLGIRPEDLPNPQEVRMEYRFKKNGKNVLISVFSLTGAKSQDECVDPPKSNPHGMRAVIQSYNSDSKSSGLKFGELEIQGAKAKKRPDGRLETSEDITINFTVETS
ncbi:MAG: DUF6786 family protein [Candidatus Jordarchaeaceae archaeon]